MSQTSRVRLSCGLLAASMITFILAGCGGGGGSTTAPVLHPPTIDAFTATPTDIVPEDSLQLSYTVTGADSTVLTPPYLKLTKAATGAVYVKPPHPVCYVLVAYNGDGRDSASLVIPMANAVPLLTASLDQDTIVQSDSAFVTYQTARADSVTLSGFGKLASASSGRVKLAPVTNKSYALIAYNSIGTDTSRFSLTVEIPERLTPVNGVFYKGTLGSSQLNHPMTFVCTGEHSDTVRGVWIHFVRQEGDGQLSTDSAKPDNTGTVSVSYTFGSTMGHAEILAFVRHAPAASACVRIRANALTPSSLGQLQYVLIEDSVATLNSLDGIPGIRRDPRGILLLYLSYASSPGVVFYVFNHNNNNLAEDSEEVVGGAVFAPYAEKTKEGIGVGSSYSDVKAAYGGPSEFTYDSTNAIYVAIYNGIGAAFLLKPADSSVLEIQLSYAPTRPAPGLRHPAAATAPDQADQPFHLMYFPPN